MDGCKYGFSLWYILFFYSYLNGLAERYPEVFDGGGIEGGNPESTYQANFSRKWGAYQTITILSNDDITKFEEVTQMPLETCLLYLCYRADKNTMETQIHKANMRKYKR